MYQVSKQWWGYNALFLIRFVKTKLYAKNCSVHVCHKTEHFIYFICSLLWGVLSVTDYTASIESQIREWIGKELEGSGCDRNFKELYRHFAWKDWEKPRKISVRIACLWTASWTRDFPNTKQSVNHSTTTFGTAEENKKYIYLQLL
jgi:hypothetical protein